MSSPNIFRSLWRGVRQRTFLEARLPSLAALPSSTLYGVRYPFTTAGSTKGKGCCTSRVSNQRASWLRRQRRTTQLSASNLKSKAAWTQKPMITLPKKRIVSGFIEIFCFVDSVCILYVHSCNPSSNPFRPLPLTASMCTCDRVFACTSCPDHA